MYADLLDMRNVEGSNSFLGTGGSGFFFMRLFWMWLKSLAQMQMQNGVSN